MAGSHAIDGACMYISWQSESMSCRARCIVALLILLPKDPSALTSHKGTVLTVPDKQDHGGRGWSMNPFQLDAALSPLLQRLQGRSYSNQRQPPRSGRLIHRDSDGVPQIARGANYVLLLDYPGRWMPSIR